MDMHAVAAQLAYSERDHDLRERIEKALNDAFYAGIEAAHELGRDVATGRLVHTDQDV